MHHLLIFHTTTILLQKRHLCFFKAKTNSFVSGVETNEIVNFLTEKAHILDFKFHYSSIWIIAHGVVWI